jgi:hypothetical protein
MDTDNDEIIELFSGTLWEAEMVKSLLEDSAIESFTRNSLLNSNLYDPIYAEGVKVMILSSDLPRAKEIVDDYFRKMKE